MTQTPEPVESRFTFRIRDLLLLVAWFAVIGGWFIDRHFLSAEITRQQQENQQRESLQDPFEREIMYGVRQGKKLRDFPEIPMLADYTITKDSEFFALVHEMVTYPEKEVAPDDCRIYIFELKSTGKEGDPSEFYLMTDGDQIIRVRHGESLNS